MNMTLAIYLVSPIEIISFLQRKYDAEMFNENEDTPYNE